MITCLLIDRIKPNESHFQSVRPIDSKPLLDEITEHYVAIKFQTTYYAAVIP